MRSFSSLCCPYPRSGAYGLCTGYTTYDYSYWTPVILLNSPYGGSSTASSSVSYTGQYAFPGVTSSTSSTNSISIGASNGEAQGYFELVDWRYEHTDVPISPCKSDYVYIYSRSGNFITKQLLPPGSSSESSELTSFSAVNPSDLQTYSSISFNNAYNTNNAGTFGSCDGNGITDMTYTTSTTSISVSVPFPAASYTAGLTLAISVSSTSSSSFTYTYPSYFGNWYKDSLNGQTGSSRGALGFSFLPCPPQTPSTPSGPTVLGVLYPGTYSTSTTDRAGYNLQYQFSWGDGSYTTTGWYASGATASASHAWYYHGAYSVTVRAYNGYVWSQWSPSLTVTITGGRCCVAKSR